MSEHRGDLKPWLVKYYIWGTTVLDVLLDEDVVLAHGIYVNLQYCYCVTEQYKCNTY